MSAEAEALTQALEAERRIELEEDRLSAEQGALNLSTTPGQAQVQRNGDCGSAGACSSRESTWYSGGSKARRSAPMRASRPSTRIFGTALASLLVGKRDVTGEKRIRERDRGYAN